MMLERAVVRAWGVTALQDSRVACVAARLRGVTARVEHVPHVVDLMKLGGPQVGIPCGICLGVDGSHFTIPETSKSLGARDRDAIIRCVRSVLGLASVLI
jgi:hypothetical protein